MVQGFSGTADVDLPLPVTYDFEVTASKYLHALRDGSVPLALLFSGTVFTRGINGFGVEQVPWHRETRYSMPVGVWHALVDLYFPNSGWLRLDRDTMGALAHFKSGRGLHDLGRGGLVLVGALRRAGLVTTLGDRARARPCGRGRGALRGLPALPVPGNLRQEPGAMAVRCLGPPEAAARSLGEESTMSTDCLARARLGRDG